MTESNDLSIRYHRFLASFHSLYHSLQARLQGSGSSTSSSSSAASADFQSGRSIGGADSAVTLSTDLALFIRVTDSFVEQGNHHQQQQPHNGGNSAAQKYKRNKIDSDFNSHASNNTHASNSHNAQNATAVGKKNGNQSGNQQKQSSGIPVVVSAKNKPTTSAASPFAASPARSTVMESTGMAPSDAQSTLAPSTNALTTVAPSTAMASTAAPLIAVPESSTVQAESTIPKVKAKTSNTQSNPEPSSAGKKRKASIAVPSEQPNHSMATEVVTAVVPVETETSAVDSMDSESSSAAAVPAVASQPKTKQHHSKADKANAVPSSSSTASNTTHATAVKDPNKPKKPRSAYFLFFDSLYKSATAAASADSTATSTSTDGSDATTMEKRPFELMEFGKQAGLKWKAMDAEQRRPYEEMAAESKRRYDELIAAYHQEQQKQAQQPQQA